MSYDARKRTSYLFQAVDFGTGSDLTEIIGIPLDAGGVGARGRVANVHLFNVTENFAGTSKKASVEVGDGTTPGLYYDSGDISDEVDTTEGHSFADNGSAIDIPAGQTSITITWEAAGGTPTGISDVLVDIDWEV